MRRIWKNIVSIGNNQAKDHVLVGCGHTWLDHKIVITDPETLVRCAPDKVGEIWASGSSVTQGYWEKLDTTKNSFSKHI